MALSIFVPAVIIFIINLVKAIKLKWPKKHLIPVIITGVIISVVILLILDFIFDQIKQNVAQLNMQSSSSIALLITYLSGLF